MEDRCIMCGELIPEGRQVCKICESHILKDEMLGVDNDSKKHIQERDFKYVKED